MSARQDVTLTQLLGIALAPVARWVRRKVLEARMRSLEGLVSYFEWQEANGRAGLADTHKRMAVARSEINALR